MRPRDVTWSGTTSRDQRQPASRTWASTWPWTLSGRWRRRCSSRWTRWTGARSPRRTPLSLWWPAAEIRISGIDRSLQRGRHSHQRVKRFVSATDLREPLHERRRPSLEKDSLHGDRSLRRSVHHLHVWRYLSPTVIDLSLENNERWLYLAQLCGASLEIISKRNFYVRESSRVCHTRWSIWPWEQTAL